MKMFLLGVFVTLFSIAVLLYFTERKGCLILPPNKGKNGGGDSGAGIVCTRFLAILPGQAGKGEE